MDQQDQLELIEFNVGTNSNENVLKVQVAPHIAKRCRKDPVYSQSLFNQICKKNLDGVTSIKVTPIKVTPVPKVIEDVRKKYWTDKEINCFLKIVKKYYLMKNAGTFENKKWLMISAELAKKNINKSPDRCRQKWKNLLRSYKTAKNQSASKFSYVEQISSILNQDGASDIPDVSDDNDNSEDSKSTQEAETPGARNLETNYTSWSGEETLRLIEIYKENKSFFNEIPKKMAWRIVSSDLKNEGIQKDADKCENKWKNLIRSYKRNKTYNNNARFYFFNEMKEILEEEDEEEEEEEDDTFLEESESQQVVNDETEEEEDEKEDEKDAQEIESDEDMESFEEITIDTNAEHNYSWTKEEIILLITSYDQNNPNKKNSNDSLWKRVSKDMELNNFERNPEECKKMCESLLAEYEKHKDSKTSNKFPFFKDIEKIFNKEKLGGDVKHHGLCKCFEKRAVDKERRHTERMQCLKRKLDIEDRKVTAFEKYVQHLTKMSA